MDPRLFILISSKCSACHQQLAGPDIRSQRRVKIEQTLTLKSTLNIDHDKQPEIENDVSLLKLVCKVSARNAEYQSCVIIDQ